MLDPFIMEEVIFEQHWNRLRKAERNRLVRQVQANQPGWTQKTRNLLRVIIGRRPIQVRPKSVIPAIHGR